MTWHRPKCRRAEDLFTRSNIELLTNRSISDLGELRTAHCASAPKHVTAKPELRKAFCSPLAVKGQHACDHHRLRGSGLLKDS